MTAIVIVIDGGRHRRVLEKRVAPNTMELHRSTPTKSDRRFVGAVHELLGRGFVLLGDLAVRSALAGCRAVRRRDAKLLAAITKMLSRNQPLRNSTDSSSESGTRAIFGDPRIQPKMLSCT